MCFSLQPTVRRVSALLAPDFGFSGRISSRPLRFRPSRAEIRPFQAFFGIRWEFARLSDQIRKSAVFVCCAARADLLDDHSFLCCLPLPVKSRGMRFFGGVTHEKRRHRFQGCVQFEFLADRIRDEIHYPGGADPERPRFQHHMRRHDGGIHVTAVLAVVFAFPGFALVIADKEHQLFIKMAGRAFPPGRELFLALQDDDSLRLIIARRRSHAPRLQYFPKLLLFHGPV